ncbi:MAG: hypothetical protein NTW26_10320 [bacterium]|nr:hypothetical protein [bacterium]
MRIPIVLLPLLLVLLAGCGSDMDDETYVAVILAKTTYMLEDELPVDEALAKAATDNGVTPEDVYKFEDSLSNDPEHLASVVEMIMNRSGELREKFAELYSQALPEAAPAVEPVAPVEPAPPIEPTPSEETP